MCFNRYSEECISLGHLAFIEATERGDLLRADVHELKLEAETREATHKRELNRGAERRESIKDLTNNNTLLMKANLEMTENAKIVCEENVALVASVESLTQEGAIAMVKRPDLEKVHPPYIICHVV